MVEYTYSLDDVFNAVADSTRRDILQRVSEAELTVSQIALAYDLGYATVSKHIKVLERSGLVMKRRNGKQTIVTISSVGVAVILAIDQLTEGLEQA